MVEFLRSFSKIIIWGVSWGISWGMSEIISGVNSQETPKTFEWHNGLYFERSRERFSEISESMVGRNIQRVFKFRGFLSFLEKSPKIIDFFVRIKGLKMEISKKVIFFAYPIFEF